MWLSCDRSPGSIFINLFVYCHLCIKYQALQLHCSAVADYDLKLYFYSTQHPPWPWCWVFWWEDFQASIIRRNLWPFKAVLETRLQRARRRCRTIWTKLATPHIFANISIGCKLNQVFQSHRIDRCVQMNLNDHMVQPQIFYKWAFDNQRIFLKKGHITQLYSIQQRPIIISNSAPHKKIICWNWIVRKLISRRKCSM